MLSKFAQQALKTQKLLLTEKSTHKISLSSTNVYFWQFLYQLLIQVKLVKAVLNHYYSRISSTKRRRSYGPVPFGGRGQLKSHQLSINPSLILRTQPAFVEFIPLMLLLDKISCPWQQIISSVIQYNQVAFFFAPQMHSII